MSDERKKRLEEIRNRKKQLQKMMEQNTQSEASSPAIPQPSSDSTSRIETSASDSATSSRTISTNPSFRAQKRNSLKNEIIYNIQKKKINESLRSSKSEHHIFGIRKERKSEETQYKLPEEFEEEKKQEDPLKQQGDKTKKLSFFASIFNASKRSSMANSLAKGKLGLISFGKVKLKDEIRNMEVRNKFFERNETNLNSLLDEKRKETKKEVETGFQGLLDAEIEKLRNEDR